MPPAVVEVNHVSFAYDKLQVLEDITLAVEEKEFLAVVGPNGGGKTTLLKLILGLEKPNLGSIRVLGTTPGRARSRIGYVSQYSALAKDFPINVEDVVLMGKLSGWSLGPWVSSADRKAAEQAMQAVDVLNLRHRRMDRLSGGQRQRVLIARALISDPDILVLDEPTASVDSRVEQDVFDLLKRLNQQTTIMLVTHDLGFISPYVTRVACLNRELVCHHAGEISAEVIEKMYGSSVKILRHDCEI